MSKELSIQEAAALALKIGEERDEARRELAESENERALVWQQAQETIAQLTRERDEARAQVLKLRIALKRLKNEASGFLYMADEATHGVTNMQCLDLRIQQAEAALAETGSEGEEKG